MSERQAPSKSEVMSYLRERRNWGRWGDMGSAGAINLIDAPKRLEAVSLVKNGRTVSLSRPFPVEPRTENPRPAQHFMSVMERPHGGGAAMDYYGVYYHGTATTHIDALCHVWDSGGMWDGKSPDEILTFSGGTYATVDAWSDGILTRGVMLDVPRHRGYPYVTLDTPVHGWELEDIAEAQGVEIRPGDAVMVYSGREAYAADNGGNWAGGDSRPGLHASCLKFVRDNDISILGWDMMDASPNEYDIPWTVHGVIFAYGVALLDNSLLEPLANACAEECRHEFMLTINPLNVIGGTGSPVNPIAVF
ncbi:MAG: cyclase family protein [Dehalococcoidia bacterium]|nr:cyclase family protein [Dehalococcoidia bacterium]